MDHQDFLIQKAKLDVVNTLQSVPGDAKFLEPFLINLVSNPGEKGAASGLIERFEKAMAPANAIAKAFRENSRMANYPTLKTVDPSGALMKANLDVGTLTDFASITGGQSLGYVSLDTQMARGTVRPDSFTLYNCLAKTAAYQVVDYWPYASQTGGPPPGAAFASYASVGTGTLTTNAGKYNLKYITLKLALDGRAITMALAAQNSFVNVEEQENTNAALSVLSSINWTNYWGNSTLYTNQYNGLSAEIPAKNKYDFIDFKTANSGKGWSDEETLFNLIYEASAEITSYRQFGRITHAFMTPITMGSMQGLVTTVLNNIANELTGFQAQRRGIVVNGDLQGMNTRFGIIQFPIDLFISARDIPVEGVVAEDGTTQSTTSAPTKPTSVTVATLAAGQTGSKWTTAYVASSGVYTYAVASCDASMKESELTYATAVSGIAATGAYQLTISNSVADVAVFRVYRSGLGYDAGTPDAAKFRFIGEVAANGTTPVTFTDLNAHIPGSETVFLLDLDDRDMALDYRYLLPLSKLNLFAQSLYLPWAVAMIGAIRVKVPKFHGMIQNYVPTQPDWDPLTDNV